MKILNFGSCNVDYVYSLDHIVRIGETQSTYKLEIFPGGKGLNQSLAMARAGAEVYHAGCVGRDGAMLTELLADNGVDISHVRTVDAKNGHAIIQVSARGDNSIFLYAGSNEMVTEKFVDAVLEDFGEGDMLLLQNEISNVAYIIEKAHQKRMCILLTPSPFRDEIRRFDLNKISYMILNEVEAGELSGKDTPEDALAYFREAYPDLCVVLTLGAKGSLYVKGPLEIRQAAFQVHVVDTTAAGDTFTGYFAAGVACGQTIAQTMKMASAAAAIAVSRNGAAPSIPLKNEVLESLKFLQPNGYGSKSELLRKQMDEYLEKNVKDASLEGLAKVLRYSTIYTGHLVKQLAGVSFSAILQDKRCRMAADLLENTALPIKEIIHSVGYENESFFRKIFKEKYGQTPLRFRQERGKNT